MITQVVFDKGYGIMWAMLLVGYFLYSRMDVAYLASGRNGFQVESMMGKYYALFSIQIAVAATIVVYPVVMILTGVHWFEIITGTVMTMSIGLVTLLYTRDVAKQVVTVIELREDGERYDHTKWSGYKTYKKWSWVWLLLGVGVLVFLQLSPTYEKATILWDFPVWLLYVGYLYVFMIGSLACIQWMGREERDTRAYKKESVKVVKGRRKEEKKVEIDEEIR